MRDNLRIMIDLVPGPLFTKAQYEKAVADLQDGMQQLQPDGHCCAVCGDSGHQAWECVRFNPLAAKTRLAMLRDRAFALHTKMHERLGDSGELDEMHHFLHLIMGVP